MHRNMKALVLTALISASCRPVIETPEKHIPHKGETAVVFRAGQPTVIVAASKNAVHQLASAVEAKDQMMVQKLTSEGRAFELPNETVVMVESESFNEREVRVLDGPLEGRRAWVPFEWLKPHVERKQP